MAPRPCRGQHSRIHFFLLIESDSGEAGVTPWANSGLAETRSASPAGSASIIQTWEYSRAAVSPAIGKLRLFGSARLDCGSLSPSSCARHPLSVSEGKIIASYLGDGNRITRLLA